MTYQYGYTLYDAKDVVDAYLYFYYNIENPTDRERSMATSNPDFAYVIQTEEKCNIIVLRANIKKVQAVCCELIPDLIEVCVLAGYKCELCQFDPYPIMKYLNDINRYKSEKFCNRFSGVAEYIYSTAGATSIYFYIEPGNNKKLEQCIKLRYFKHIFISDKGIYVQLCPQDTFDMIFDFIDNVFNLI